jgi:hypothetical protein
MWITYALGYVLQLRGTRQDIELRGRYLPALLFVADEVNNGIYFVYDH